MNMKFSLAAAALCAVSIGAAAQMNIQDVRDNYNIGQTVTVVGVVTSDDNLGSVRYLQDATAGIAIYPGQDWSSWTQHRKLVTASRSQDQLLSTMDSLRLVAGNQMKASSLCNFRA